VIATVSSITLGSEATHPAYSSLGFVRTLSPVAGLLMSRSTSAAAIFFRDRAGVAVVGWALIRRSLTIRDRPAA
jgi:hypothetical protein